MGVWLVGPDKRFFPSKVPTSIYVLDLKPLKAQLNSTLGPFMSHIKVINNHLKFKDSIPTYINVYIWQKNIVEGDCAFGINSRCTFEKRPLSLKSCIPFHQKRKFMYASLNPFIILLILHHLLVSQFICFPLSPAS